MIAPDGFVVTHSTFYKTNMLHLPDWHGKQGLTVCGNRPELLPPDKDLARAAICGRCRRLHYQRRRRDDAYYALPDVIEEGTRWLARLWTEIREAPGRGT